jgi:hypothetical protein
MSMDQTEQASPKPDMAPEAMELLTSSAEIDLQPASDVEEPDYIGAVFRSDVDGQTVVTAPATRTTFEPWHHPVKQIVRDYQWVDHVKRLLNHHRPENDRHQLRYFTLPGADLLDVRMLAESLAPMGTTIDYFGFNSGYESNGTEGVDGTGTYLLTESSLRQAGRISAGAVILRDKLEDIALAGSNAAERLRQQGVFDVINIDACSHLGIKPTGRNASVFDALEKLLAHQLNASCPWLLFVTTRADAAQLGEPAEKMRSAIMSNLDTHQDGFAEALVGCIGGSVPTITADMANCWSTQGVDLLKLFCLGLGKHLLQWFHAQLNHPAAVELVSGFAYKVSGDQPNMLALAFRISPRGVAIQSPSAGGVIKLPDIELSDAVAIASKAAKIWDLDVAIADDDQVRAQAVSGTERLLASANYDIPKWREWLRNHPVRPMDLADGV